MKNKRSDLQIMRLANSIAHASVDDLVLLSAMCSIKLNWMIDDDVNLIDSVFDCIDSIENNAHLMYFLGVKNEKADSKKKD